MRNSLQNSLEKFRRFMYGRNGIDKLTVFMMLLYLLINGIGSFIFNPIVRVSFLSVSALLAVVSIYRVFSKNLYRRQYEEEKFENLLRRINFQDNIFKIKRYFKRQKIRFQQRKTYRFRVCPQCDENLRISKKRGKRNITCPKCGKQFNVHIFF